MSADEEPKTGRNGDSEIIELEISDTLDLHSFPPEQVGDVVRSWLDAVIERGFRQVRIIHGRGIGAQRRTVRAILERDPRVREFSDAEPGAGGWGATCALLDPSGEETS